MLTPASQDVRGTVSWTAVAGLDQHTVPQKPKRICLKVRVLALAATLTAGYVVLGAATAAAQESGPYPDVPSDAYYTAAVEELADKGVFAATECDEGFCPDDPIDRATMAVWTVRVLDGADPLPVTATRFTDVDAAHRYAAFIERFAELGVTQGCGDGTEFCPDDTVPRAEMAVFLTRAFGLDEGPDPGFDDVPSDAWYASEVASLAASGITTGCGDGSGFCPDRATPRDQMAVFLHRAINPNRDHPGGPLVAIESTAPLVTRTAFEITLRFSQPVSGLSRSDLMVVNGRATSLSGSEERYTARIEPQADGIVMVRLPAGTVAAGDGSPNQASAPFVRTIAPAARLDAPGFDTWNRGLVFQSMHVELLRQQPAWGYTGDVIRCVAGTTSQAFRDSVIQRINWYRQMAGLGTVTEDPGLSASAQQAALMMAAHGELSHYPDSDWTCFNGQGAASAGRSNLFLGRAGTSGIDGYIQDPGADNRPVGHRRWILDPATLEMGTGDVGYPYPANALDVAGGDRLGSRPDVREERGFVAWPPSGYVPPGVVWGRWSFSLAGADFRESSVVVTDDSGPVQVELLVRSRGYIVWAVAGDTDSNLLPAPSNGDQCYAVAVSGVRIDGKTATPFEYPVCVIDPEAPDNPPVPLIDETYVGRPRVTVSSAAPSEVNAAFLVTISFSEPVVVPVQSSPLNNDLTGIVSVGNGNVSNIFCGYEAEFRECYARIVPREPGSVIVSVDSGVVQDRDGEPNLASDLLSRESAVSTTGPPTASLSSSAPPVVTDSFEVTITFSEPVVVTVQEDSLYNDLTSFVSVANGTVWSIVCGHAILVCRAIIMPDDHG
ncbi:MAG: S-layer homology domain-containing protein, partial [Gemmatimonadota bacterium]|nr:S-layer homology domain-containing protein [Gemmatimonadota bacterium]